MTDEKIWVQAVDVIIHRREMYGDRINRNWVRRQESNIMAKSISQDFVHYKWQEAISNLLKQKWEFIGSYIWIKTSVFYCFSDLLFMLPSSSGQFHICGSEDGSWPPELLCLTYRLENLHQKGVTVHMFQLESSVWLSMGQFKSDVHPRSWSLGQPLLNPMDWEIRRVSQKEETEDR